MVAPELIAVKLFGKLGHKLEVLACKWHAMLLPTLEPIILRVSNNVALLGAARFCDRHRVQIHEEQVLLFSIAIPKLSYHSKSEQVRHPFRRNEGLFLHRGILHKDEGVACWDHDLEE